MNLARLEEVSAALRTAATHCWIGDVAVVDTDRPGAGAAAASDVVGALRDAAQHTCVVTLSPDDVTPVSPSVSDAALLRLTMPVCCRPDVAAVLGDAWGVLRFFTSTASGDTSCLVLRSVYRSAGGAVEGGELAVAAFDADPADMQAIRSLKAFPSDIDEALARIGVAVDLRRNQLWPTFVALLSLVMQRDRIRGGGDGTAHATSSAPVQLNPSITRYLGVPRSYALDPSPGVLRVLYASALRWLVGLLNGALRAASRGGGGAPAVSIATFVDPPSTGSHLHAQIREVLETQYSEATESVGDAYFNLVADEARRGWTLWQRRRRGEAGGGASCPAAGTTAAAAGRHTAAAEGVGGQAWRDDGGGAAAPVAPAPSRPPALESTTFRRRSNTQTPGASAFSAPVGLADVPHLPCSVDALHDEVRAQAAPSTPSELLSADQPVSAFEAHATALAATGEGIQLRSVAMDVPGMRVSAGAEPSGMPALPVHAAAAVAAPAIAGHTTRTSAMAVGEAPLPQRNPMPHRDGGVAAAADRSEMSPWDDSFVGSTTVATAAAAAGVPGPSKSAGSHRGPHPHHHHHHHHLQAQRNAHGPPTQPCSDASGVGAAGCPPGHPRPTPQRTATWHPDSGATLNEMMNTTVFNVKLTEYLKDVASVVSSMPAQPVQTPVAGSMWSGFPDASAVGGACSPIAVDDSGYRVTPFVSTRSGPPPQPQPSVASGAGAHDLDTEAPPPTAHQFTTGTFSSELQCGPREYEYVAAGGVDKDAAAASAARWMNTTTGQGSGDLAATLPAPMRLPEVRDSCPTESASSRGSAHTQSHQQPPRGGTSASASASADSPVVAAAPHNSAALSSPGVLPVADAFPAGGVERGSPTHGYPQQQQQQQLPPSPTRPHHLQHPFRRVGGDPGSTVPGMPRQTDFQTGPESTVAPAPALASPLRELAVNVHRSPAGVGHGTAAAAKADGGRTDDDNNAGGKRAPKRYYVMENTPGPCRATPGTWERRAHAGAAVRTPPPGVQMQAATAAAAAAAANTSQQQNQRRQQQDEEQEEEVVVDDARRAAAAALGLSPELLASFGPLRAAGYSCDGDDAMPTSLLAVPGVYAAVAQRLWGFSLGHAGEGGVVADPPRLGRHATGGGMHGVDRCSSPPRPETLYAVGPHSPPRVIGEGWSAEAGCTSPPRPQALLLSGEDVAGRASPERPVTLMHPVATMERDAVGGGALYDRHHHRHAAASPDPSLILGGGGAGGSGGGPMVPCAADATTEAAPQAPRPPRVDDAMDGEYSVSADAFDPFAFVDTAAGAGVPGSAVVGVDGRGAGSSPFPFVPGERCRCRRAAVAALLPEWASTNPVLATLCHPNDGLAHALAGVGVATTQWVRCIRSSRLRDDLPKVPPPHATTRALPVRMRKYRFVARYGAAVLAWLIQYPNPAEYRVGRWKVWMSPRAVTAIETLHVRRMEVLTLAACTAAIAATPSHASSVPLDLFTGEEDDHHTDGSSPVDGVLLHNALAAHGHQSVTATPASRMDAGDDDDDDGGTHEHARAAAADVQYTPAAQEHRITSRTPEDARDERAAADAAVLNCARFRALNYVCDAEPPATAAGVLRRGGLRTLSPQCGAHSGAGDGSGAQRRGGPRTLSPRGPSPAGGARTLSPPPLLDNLPCLNIHERGALAASLSPQHARPAAAARDADAHHDRGAYDCEYSGYGYDTSEFTRPALPTPLHRMCSGERRRGRDLGGSGAPSPPPAAHLSHPAPVGRPHGFIETLARYRDVGEGWNLGADSDGHVPRVYGRVHRELTRGGRAPANMGSMEDYSRGGRHEDAGVSRRGGSLSGRPNPLADDEDEDDEVEDDGIDDSLEADAPLDSDRWYHGDGAVWAAHQDTQHREDDAFSDGGFEHKRISPPRDRERPRVASGWWDGEDDTDDVEGDVGASHAIPVPGAALSQPRRLAALATPPVQHADASPPPLRVGRPMKVPSIVALQQRQQSHTQVASAPRTRGRVPSIIALQQQRGTV